MKVDVIFDKQNQTNATPIKNQKIFTKEPFFPMRIYRWKTVLRALQSPSSRTSSDYLPPPTCKVSQETDIKS
jgi:hypothetical protein